MATIMNRQKPRHLSAPRTLTQKVCIGLGIVLTIGAIGGVFMPAMLGLHLSFAHNLIHLFFGLLALWCGYADEERTAYSFCLYSGIVYGVVGITGLLYGTPGFPGVGAMTSDQKLLRILPNVLEFGSHDHALHIVFSVAFLLTAFASKNWFVTNRKIDTTRRTESERRT